MKRIILLSVFGIIGLIVISGCIQQTQSPPTCPHFPKPEGGPFDGSPCSGISIPSQGISSWSINPNTCEVECYLTNCAGDLLLDKENCRCVDPESEPWASEHCGYIKT